MEFDAISAGVSKIGGLFKTADVRILICYILSSFDKPIPGAMLCEVLHHEGIANAFEVGDSLGYLEENGHIEEVNDKGDAGYIATKKGIDVAKTLETSLTFIVKDRAYTAVSKMMIRLRNAKESSFEVTKENGRTFITCTALDRDIPFMSVKLMVSDEDHAMYIKEKFLDNSNEIFPKVMEMLTRGDTKK